MVLSVVMLFKWTAMFHGSVCCYAGDKEQRDMLSKWTELGTNEPDLAKFRPVYAAKDFLDVITALRNPNQVNCSDGSVTSGVWGIVQVGTITVAHLLVTAC